MSSAAEYDRMAREIRAAASGRSGLDARELVRLATLAASSHNTQPWKFRITPQRITILPDFARRCPVVDPDDGHLFKSLGCAAENLVHAAAAQGYAADVRFVSADAGVCVNLTRTVARPSELHAAIVKRQCVRKPYDGKPLGCAEMAALQQAGAGRGVRVIMLGADAGKDAVIEYVTRGNHAQLSDPAFRRELASWIRFNPREALRKRDGISGRSNERPPIPTWLARRMSRILLAPKGQSDIDARNIRSAAGIAVFVAEADDQAAWVEVGRAYQRFALRATVLGIRNAFINQPLEVRALRPQFESWLQLAGERTLLLVRIGRGPSAPFSLRRCVDDVILPE